MVVAGRTEAINDLNLALTYTRLFAVTCHRLADSITLDSDEKKHITERFTIGTNEVTIDLCYLLKPRGKRGNTASPVGAKRQAEPIRKRFRCHRAATAKSRGRFTVRFQCDLPSCCGVSY